MGGAVESGGEVEGGEVEGGEVEAGEVEAGEVEALQGGSWVQRLGSQRTVLIMCLSGRSVPFDSVPRISKYCGVVSGTCRRHRHLHRCRRQGGGISKLEVAPASSYKGGVKPNGIQAI